MAFSDDQYRLILDVIGTQGLKNLGVEAKATEKALQDLTDQYAKGSLAWAEWQKQSAKLASTMKLQQGILEAGAQGGGFFDKYRSNITASTYAIQDFASASGDLGQKINAVSNNIPGVLSGMGQWAAGIGSVTAVAVALYQNWDKIIDLFESPEQANVKKVIDDLTKSANESKEALKAMAAAQTDGAKAAKAHADALQRQVDLNKILDQDGQTKRDEEAAKAGAASVQEPTAAQKADEANAKLRAETYDKLGGPDKEAIKDRLVDSYDNDPDRKRYEAEMARRIADEEAKAKGMPALTLDGRGAPTKNPAIVRIEQEVARLKAALRSGDRYTPDSYAFESQERASRVLGGAKAGDANALQHILDQVGGKLPADSRNAIERALARPEQVKGEKNAEARRKADEVAKQAQEDAAKAINDPIRKRAEDRAQQAKQASDKRKAKSLRYAEYARQDRELEADQGTPEEIALSPHLENVGEFQRRNGVQLSPDEQMDAAKQAQRFAGDGMDPYEAAKLSAGTAVNQNRAGAAMNQMLPNLRKEAAGVGAQITPDMITQALKEAVQAMNQGANAQAAVYSSMVEQVNQLKQAGRRFSQIGNRFNSLQPQMQSALDGGGYQ